VKNGQTVKLLKTALRQNARTKHIIMLAIAKKTNNLKNSCYNNNKLLSGPNQSHFQHWFMLWLSIFYNFSPVSSPEVNALPALQMHIVTINIFSSAHSI